MRKQIFNYSIITFCLLAIISCSKTNNKLEIALKEAEGNRPELEKVLRFYKENLSDSLKYKAAVFLIENMPNHTSYKTIKGFQGAFDSIYNYPKSDFRRDVFENILDSVSKNNSKITELFSDIKVLTSDFIINNIELSFEAWNKVPKNRRASFDDFCNYILPYKTTNEPIEENSREKLFRKYAWVYNYLDRGASLVFIVDSITSEIGYRNIAQLRKYYPAPLSISQNEKSKLGLCDDGVNYFVNVFRALGLVSAKDMVSHWGNHPSSGHSWFYVKCGDEEYSTNLSGDIDLTIHYKNESIPKVSRLMYVPQKEYVMSKYQKDVTDEYVPTVNIEIDNLFNTSNSTPVLCVFDYYNEWKPISFGENNGNNNEFNNIGVNVLYLAANIDESNFVPVNYPFFVDMNKKIHFFKPTQSILDSVVLTRKIGLSTPRNRRKIEWITNLNGGVFQGSNNQEFNKATILYEISDFRSTQINKVKLHLKEKFKYVRFYSNKKESFLTNLFFYDDNEKQLKGKILKENNKELKWKNGAFDNDVPKNSLLWLRNLTKGKEEHVFTIDKDKKQRWLGFDNDY